MSVLTDKKFWEEYWKSKSDDIIFNVGNDLVFNEIFKSIINENIRSSLELGGYPGYFSVFLKKYYDLQPTLLDFYIDKEQFNKLLKINGLEENDVKVIETDLFQYNASIKYDLVFSIGVIEHFENTYDIVAKHAGLLNKNGVLFIDIPNFTGFNGLLQWLFDKPNLYKHNLKCMNLKLLYDVCNKLGFKEISVKYYGRFDIWLENETTRSPQIRFMMRLFRKILALLYKVLKKGNKWLSPYIIAIAK